MACFVRDIREIKVQIERKAIDKKVVCRRPTMRVNAIRGGQMRVNIASADGVLSCLWKDRRS